MPLKSWWNKLSHLPNSSAYYFARRPGERGCPNATIMRTTSFESQLSPVDTPAPVKKLVLGYEVGGFVVVGTRVGAAGRGGTARLREFGVVKLVAACARDGGSPVTVNSAG